MNRRLVFLTNNAAFLVSHRLPIALGAVDAGYSVSILFGQPGSASMEKLAIDELKNCHLGYKKLFFSSAGLNLIFEVVGFFQLFFLLRRIKPDLLYCASPKGVLYGGLAARLAGVGSLVLAISGMGFAFTKSQKNLWLRKVVAFVYNRFFLYVLKHKNIRVIVQNKDDYAFILSKIESSKINLISGSGVDLERFVNFPIEKKEPIVVLPARMVEDKGVLEFIDAVKTLKVAAPGWKFILAGAADFKNPSAISLDLICSWRDRGLVEWAGHVEDIASLLGKASIVCLPSYREGMPKALLEAAAAGCAIVTTDVVGCRDAIIPGETGDLVTVQDSQALVDSIYSLIVNRKKREQYGRKGRDLAIRNFSVQDVVRSTLEVCRELIKSAN